MCPLYLCWLHYLLCIWNTEEVVVGDYEEMAGKVQSRTLFAQSHSTYHILIYTLLLRSECRPKGSGLHRTPQSAWWKLEGTPK
ncbi:hypothetical protein LX32DRAFT_414800 [Colletotrichum zoysiae]|uniref:Secreted protein n=1 Tax=Colletotrichum zoysiae TaxID=1216348 RepID=A0AAD9M132_9PEZI|nr:hypothetical protein LX32DRAFT_414800 [Colletotrichum zoysiae]